MRFLAFQIRISFNEQVANTSEYILFLNIIQLYVKSLLWECNIINPVGMCSVSYLGLELIAVHPVDV